MMFGAIVILSAPALFLACSCLSSASASPSTSEGNISNIPIRSLAAPRYFGTAANTTFLFHDANYTKIAEKQFSIFTPENEMKWENLQPFQGVFNFTPADEIVRFSKSVHGAMRGHNFLWGNQLPSWVNTSLTGIELDRILQTQIQTVMTHYKKDKIYAWDIINEMISDTPDVNVYKQNIWTQKLGEASLAKALLYAHAADPSVRLYINEYGAEGINAKSDALFNVVKGFQKDGKSLFTLLLGYCIPIHGVGFQCHFALGGVPSTLQTNLERFAALGVDVAVTELDINLGSFGNETAYQAQAKDYQAVVDACVRVERCVSVSTWGITDDYSWIQNKSVLPWDGQGQPKPAFFAIQDAFAATRGGKT